jgi:hypothetical protein
VREKQESEKKEKQRKKERLDIEGKIGERKRR